MSTGVAGSDSVGYHKRYSYVTCVHVAFPSRLRQLNGHLTKSPLGPSLRQQISIAMIRCIALVLCALTCSGATSLAPARPLSAAKALALRGGAVPSVSLCAAASPRSKKATFVLGANALVSTAYGILATCKPNAMLAIYGVASKIDFMSPAYGVCQYLGGMHIVVALRCFAALGFPGFPERDPKETLEGMFALHTVAGLVAGFRQFKGSSSPVVGSVLMAGLALWAKKD